MLPPTHASRLCSPAIWKQGRVGGRTGGGRGQRRRAPLGPPLLSDCLCTRSPRWHSRPARARPPPTLDSHWSWYPSSHAFPTLHSSSSPFHSCCEKKPPLHCGGGGERECGRLAAFGRRSGWEVNSPLKSPRWVPAVSAASHPSACARLTSSDWPPGSIQLGRVDWQWVGTGGGGRLVGGGGFGGFGSGGRRLRAGADGRVRAENALLLQRGQGPSQGERHGGAVLNSRQPKPTCPAL